MATYGRGQMLGSGINPESFKQDFSGFANAAAIQAQGLSNLGASIGSAIKDFGEVRQERKKIDAETKASRLGIESAIKLGESLGFDVKGTLSPVLSQMDDPNTTPMEAAALGREASSQIANVLNLGFKAQDQMLEKARLSQDAAYKTEQLKISLQNANSRARAAIAAGGSAPRTVDIPLGDGSTQKMQWSQEDNSFIPIKVSGLGDTSQTVKGNDLISLVKNFENFEPKAYNDYKQISVGYGTKGKPGEVLTEEQASERLQSELFGHAKRIENAAALKGITLNKNQFNALTSFDFNTGRGANLIERFGDDPQQLASKILEYNKAGGEVKGGLVKRRQIEAALFLAPEEQVTEVSQVTPQNQLIIGVTPAKPQKTSRIVTGEEAKQLGGDPNKEYIVVNEGETTTRVSPVSPDTIPATQQKELAIAEARILYDQGDPVSAAQKLNAYGIQGSLGGAVSPNDLPDIFGERRIEQVTPPSTEAIPNQSAPAKKPLGQIIK
jgi:GH24 family phage-related lysozyme (muramidase)